MRFKATKFIFPIVLFCVLFISAGSVKANVSQLDGNWQGSYFAKNSPPFPVQSLGTGISGHFGNIQLLLDSYPNSTHTTNILLFECDNSADAMTASGSCVLKDTYSAYVGIHGGENGTPALIDFVDGSNRLANPQKYYAFELKNTFDFGAVWFWGSHFLDTYPNGSLHSSSGNIWWHYPDGVQNIYQMYFNIAGVSVVPPTAAVSIQNPPSGSTITDNSTVLHVNWSNINYTAFPFIWLSFTSSALGEYSESYHYAISSDNGTFDIALSAFNITGNGEWSLRATAEHDANLFLDLLSSQTYTLNFNIGGLPTPYEFSNFDTWYSENSAGGYAEPSDWATSLTAFIQPIFVSSGQFVNSSLAYFKSTDFYDKGNQLGVVFPTTQAYLNKINIFFGGFPLIQFFEFLTFVMLGIFIVRTIFKFIPFFG